MAQCKQCGKELKKKSHKKGGVRKFCNNECYAAYRDFKEWNYTTCHYCGKTFKEQRDRQNLYCCNKCRSLAESAETTQRKEAQNEHDAKLLREYREALQRVEELRFRIEHEKFCIVCGKLFTAKSKTQVTCSPECSRKHDNARRDGRIYRNGEPDLSINLGRLYRRDGGVCQACGKHLTFDVDPQSGDYPSIDHIWPISKGGTHTWDNVQLLCRQCNWEKGDRVDG